jgi:hypothetical protein
MVAVGLLEQTEQQYLVSGRIFLPCDANFGLIEGKKRVTKAFVPSDLHKIVQDAKVVKSFEIVPMLPSNFLNIQMVADEIICAKSLNISKIVSIMYDSTDLSRVGVKESFGNVEVCKMIRILKGNSMNDIRTAQFEAGTSEHSITEEKKWDLRAMIPYLAQEQYTAFYMEMCGDNIKLKWHMTPTVMVIPGLSTFHDLLNKIFFLFFIFYFSQVIINYKCSNYNSLFANNILHIYLANNVK